MNEFLTILAGNGNAEMIVSLVVEILCAVVSLVVAFIVYKRTGNLKKSIQIMQEVDEKLMKYRMSDYRQENHEEVSTTGQTFSNFETQYKYNKNTKMLEELPNKRDIQAEIDSYKNCALDYILEKFLPAGGQIQEVTTRLNKYEDDLFEMSKLSQLAEDYKDRFGLSEDLSIEDVFAEVSKQSDLLKTQIDEYNKVKTELDTKFGGKDNEESKTE